MTTDEEFEKWLLAYYIREGHYFSKDELRECWLAATKATAARCVEICMNQVSRPESRIVTVTDCAAAIKQEFDLE